MIETVVHAIQAMPYVWPCPPEAAWARRNGAGSCASKHALLAEELEGIGLTSLSVAGGRLAGARHPIQ